MTFNWSYLSSEHRNFSHVASGAFLTSLRLAKFTESFLDVDIPTLYQFASLWWPSAAFGHSGEHGRVWEVA